jgi:osmotically-inducible protein OsmY
MVKASTHRLSWLGGIGIGAALMYFLDPKRGARRRHMVKDQAAGAARSGRGQLRKALVARVRAALGHHMRNAGAIDVTVRGRTVILRGPVDGDQVEDVVRSAAKVRGVWQVENQLDVMGATANA